MFVLTVKSHFLLQELTKLNYVSGIRSYEALSRVSSGQSVYDTVLRFCRSTT